MQTGDSNEGEAGQGFWTAGTSGDPITRQPDLWSQDHFQCGLVEDLFADLHLGWPVHPRQDGGIPWGESMEASPMCVLPLGLTTRHLTVWASLWPTTCWQ